jgi:glycosyltransferase involved in cell wall biosynthesis
LSHQAQTYGQIGSYGLVGAYGQYGIKGSYFDPKQAASQSSSYGRALGTFGPPAESGVQYGRSNSTRVSVLVTARNYARFLADCLHSILAQTVKPSEIVYCDDGSDDNSMDVARRFESDGVRVLPGSRVGVIAARNRAVAASSGDLLLHVDGDDLLAPDFLAQHLKSLDGAAVAYGPMQHFGSHEGLWKPPGWERDRLWLENYIHTSALVRRDAFEAAGGWIETPARAFWDWNLWLRVTRRCKAVRSNAVLYYRRHHDNWSRMRQNSPPEQAARMKGDIRISASRVAVCVVYSGRLPTLFPQWLDAIIETTSHLRRDQLELFVLDDSPHGFWSAAAGKIDRLQERFESLRVARVHSGTKWSDRRPDRAGTARFLTSVYNRFLDECDAEVLWFVEDDVVVPPEAGESLLRLLLDGDRPKGAVTGLYKSRYDDCFVVSRYLDGNVCHARHAPRAAEPCDMAGTGCLMVFRPGLAERFAPFWHVPNTGAPVPAHDWSFTWQLRRAGRPVWVEPHVRCRHYLDEQAWV